jgi:membrane associated rhomboid family serine protease
MGWHDRDWNRDEAASGMQMRLGFPPPTRMALGVIAACFAMFVLQNLVRGSTAWLDLTFERGLAFWQPWRLVTYQYLHLGPWHIFFNLLGIYFFLPPLERHWGWRGSLAFYTGGGLAAAILFGLMSAVWHVPSALVGASGCVFAALAACAVLFPQQQILLLVFLVPIRVVAVLLGILWLLQIIGSGPEGLSSAAHLGGLAFGVLVPWKLLPAARRWAERREAARAVREMRLQAEEEEAVDRILAKVHAQGMQSLTARERRTLERASRRERERGDPRGRLR